MTIEGLKTSWRDTARRHLRNRPVTLQLKHISEQTGIPEAWLSRFAQGHIDGPDVNRIETLLHFFESKQTEVAI